MRLIDNDTLRSQMAYNPRLLTGEIESVPEFALDCPARAWMTGDCGGFDTRHDCGGFDARPSDPDAVYFRAANEDSDVDSCDAF